MDEKLLHEAVYQNTRIGIITLRQLNNNSAGITDEYAYAWVNEIYPFEAPTKIHEPFAKRFKISKDEMTVLAEFLDAIWMKNEGITFYELESAAKSKKLPGDWDRVKLLLATRYFYLKGMFRGHGFWETMIKPMEHPMEASSITDDVKGYELQIF